MPTRTPPLATFYHRPATWHPQLLLPFKAAPFSTSAFRSDTAHIDNSTNHYETLGLQPNATPADIKKQFYALSKQHHPDRNQGDANSSSRFVKISEAYHVLGSPHKRSTYDRDLLAARQPHHAHHHPPGSHFGSRPASGLSRRRTTFRGPPPSFFRNGAWGAHAAKRGHYQNQPRSDGNPRPDENDHPSASSSFNGAQSGGGFGAASAGFNANYTDANIPHWDRRGHQRTQDNLSQHATARRRRQYGLAEEPTEEELLAQGEKSLLARLIVVGGAVGLILGIPIALGKAIGATPASDRVKKKKKKFEDKGGAG